MNLRKIRRNILVQIRRGERKSTYAAYRKTQVKQGKDYKTFAAFTFKPEPEQTADTEGQASHE